MLKVPGSAEGGFLFLSPPSVPPCRPATAHWWLPPLISGEEWGRLDSEIEEVVLLALSLERACQFIKAFGERGGNLHVT